MIDKLRLDELCTPKSSNLAQKDIQENDGDYPVYGASGFIKNINFYHQETDYIAVVKDGAGIGRAMFLPAKSSIIGTMQYLIPKNSVDPKYLYYAVKGMNLSKYYSGATIPHIYFKDYKKELVPLYSKDQQKMISRSLEKVEELIIKKQQLLNEYDQLIKSRFVEMFGDVTQKNNGYTINDVCRTMIRGPFGSSLKKEFFVPKGVSTYKVYEQKHAINKKVEIGEYYIDEKKFNELKRFEVQPGDVIMSCSGTIGELFVIPDSAERGIINQALLNFRLNYEVINKDYFLYAMDAIIYTIDSKGSGIENITSVSNIKNTNIYLPPLLEQNNFSIFVKQVDKLKFAVQKSLDETQTLFDSLMQKYFG